MADETVEAGRAAWDRLCKRGSKDFEDWVSVGRALVVGRAEAMRLANINRPHGKRYTSAMRAWLDANGLGEMSQPERHSATRMVDNLEAIERWRAGLDERMRRKLNHPDGVWQNFKRAGKAPKPKQYQRKPKPTAGRSLKPVYWPQDTIRRAADALRESRSNDLFVLARAALEAALPHEADVLALLEQPKHPRAKSEPAELVAA